MLSAWLCAFGAYAVPQLRSLGWRVDIDPEYPWQTIGNDAPLYAAAFYLRYGSAPVIAGAIAAAGLVWWRTIAARPLPALAALALLAALGAPHLVRSVLATGSPLGILETSAGMPRRAK